MMAEQHCIYPDRESVLVAYLYDDVDAVQRVAFETHVATCEPCRTELADLRAVRSRLAEWAAPESASRSHQSPVSSRQSRWWHDVPVWAQVAAALLVLGVSASIANLDVRYDRANGLSVRTGWSKPAPAVAATPAIVDVANAAPWRADLAPLQKQFRDELRAKPATVVAASAAPAAMSDADFRRVRVMVDESEQKQKTEFASKLILLQKDVYAQEQYDLANVYKVLGVSARAAAANQQKVNMLLSPR